MRRIARFVWRERAQTERRKQKHLHRIDDPPRFLFRQQHERQSADGEDLVRSECKIDRPGLMIAIDHVGEITGVLRSRICSSKARAAFFEERLPTRGELRADGERVQPERLNFHRLADTRRDLAAIDARVHPGELLTVFAGREQAVDDRRGCRSASLR